MLLPLLQITTVAALVWYLGCWSSRVRHRNSQTWESLLAQLCPEWSARELSDQFLWKEGLNATLDDVWQRMEGPRGLWVIFRNTRILLEMADFAEQNYQDVDRTLLANLRSDAMQIRLCVLLALAQYAFSSASEGVRVNALRAASLYTGMAARMTCLLQQNAASVLPDFVAAM